MARFTSGVLFPAPARWPRLSPPFNAQHIIMLHITPTSSCTFPSSAAESSAKAAARESGVARHRLLARCGASLLSVVALTLGGILTSCAGTSTPDGTAPVAIPAPAPARAPYSTRDHQLDLDSFEVVWTTIRDKHWDPTLGGLDWQAVHDELRPKVEQASSRHAARSIMTDMVHRLKQSHFNIVPASAYDSEEIEDSDDQAVVTNDTARSPAVPANSNEPKVAENSSPPQKPRSERSPGEGATGIDLRILEGKAVVTRVTPGSPADVAGVKTGWIISRIDGASTETRFDRVGNAYAESTMRAYYMVASVLGELSGGIGDDVEIEFIDGGDTPITRHITLGPLEGTPARFGNLPTTYVTIDSRRLPQNIHYFRLSIFFDPPKLSQQLGDAVRGAADADGFIIDLRGNPGGIGGLAAGVAGWFVSQPSLKLGTMYTRSGSLNFNVNPRLNGYRGPLAVLIDGMSASTSEVLAGGVKDIGRARIFGTQSAGAALPSVFEVLPNNDRFQYAMANYISASGQALEGVGVTPDEVVTLDRQSLLAGKDAVLDAAITWIESQKNALKPASESSK
ncbi:MAG: hypothetical protein H7210_03435 [Pyrinomonadaceae bacterium]|nr:hypothetical protein [Phycisphaerales bacterium]